MPTHPRHSTSICTGWNAMLRARSPTEAARLREASTPWPQLLEGYQAATPATLDSPTMFLVETLLHVFPPDPCSHDALPMVSLLREAGHGSRRSYVCGVCLAETPAPRLGCLACGETRVDALPVFRSEDTEPARIDACDTCHAYMKTIDLTRDGVGVPDRRRPRHRVARPVGARARVSPRAAEFASAVERSDFGRRPRNGLCVGCGDGRRRWRPFPCSSTIVLL